MGSPTLARWIASTGGSLPSRAGRHLPQQVFFSQCGFISLFGIHFNFLRGLYCDLRYFVGKPKYCEAIFSIDSLQWEAMRTQRKPTTPQLLCSYANSHYQANSKLTNGTEAL